MLGVSRKVVMVVAGAGALLGATRASSADPWGSWEWDHMAQVGVMVGGGVLGFTDHTMRDTTSVAGTWDARLELGTRMPVALELGYMGSAQDINARFGTATSATPTGTLLGTTVEADLRANAIPEGPVQPYAFAGAGWQHWDVTNMGDVPMSVSGFGRTDDVVELPIGIGISFLGNGFIADVRGTMRFATDQNLVLTDPIQGSYAPMHTWAAIARIGFEM